MAVILDAMSVPPPLVISVGLAVDRTTTSFARAGRRLRFQALNLVTGGRGRFAGEDRVERQVAAGDLLSLHRGAWHRFAPEPGTRWNEYWVVYDPEAVGRRLGRELVPPPGILAGGGEAPAWFEEMHGLSLARLPGWQVRADLAFHAVLVAAWRQRVGDRAPARDDVVGRACGWLHEGLADPARSLDAFARREGLSVERLRKRFRAALGVPPGDWLLQVRLRTAQQQLLGTGMEIQEIARRTGFADPFHFSRMFRRHVGLSPRAFRQRGG